MQRNGDVTFPFRQDSNFYYLTGLRDLADVTLVMADEEEFLILPQQTETEAIFGGIINCDEVAKTSGVKQVLSYNEGWNKFKKLQNNRKIIQTLLPPPQKITQLDSYYTNPTRRRLLQRIKRANPNIKVEDMRSELMNMRQVKQPEEINAIKRAIAITKEGFSTVQRCIQPGVNEYELEAEFDYVFKKHNTTHGYAPPIIASGKNSCILHYSGKLGTLKAGQLVLLDVGAEYGLYSADISRTYPVSTLSDRQQQVYEAIRAVSRASIDILKPGLTWRDFVDQVEMIMGEQLIDLGLIKHNTHTNVRHYFPHGISHNLGLDVHDVCDYKVMQENMIITVEPGIYIPEEAIGIRIEDDVLITKTGATNLSVSIAY